MWLRQWDILWYVRIIRLSYGVGSGKFCEGYLERETKVLGD